MNEITKTDRILEGNIKNAIVVTTTVEKLKFDADGKIIGKETTVSSKRIDL